jgi:anti-sigma factor RsiW
MGERFDNELDRLLAGRLDGDLTPFEANRLDELLAGDERARRTAGQMQRLDSLVRRWGAKTSEVEVDWSAFRAGVMGHVRQESQRRARSFPVYRILSIAGPLAAAAAIIAALTLHWSTGRSGRRDVASLPKPSVVVQVAYQRPAEPASPAPAGEISIVFYRSAELERSTAARDAAERGGASLAVASGTKVVAPAAPPSGLEPFQL